MGSPKHYASTALLDLMSWLINYDIVFSMGWWPTPTFQVARMSGITSLRCAALDVLRKALDAVVERLVMTEWEDFCENSRSTHGREKSGISWLGKSERKLNGAHPESFLMTASIDS
jgi:hypothetical protein